MNDVTEIVEDFEEPKSKSEIPPPEQAAASATGVTIAAIEEEPVSRVGHYRWVICALLFFAATVNYIDRQVLGILKPTLQGDFGWQEIDYGWIVFSFQTAYALGLLVVGRLMDRFGTKKGFAYSITLWSLAAMAHAWIVPIGTAAAVVLGWFGYISTSTAFVSILGFIIVRFLLGLGEAGNFPASIKTVAEWFPKKERALATGIFNSGTNVGAIVTPLVVPWVAATWGWRWAFIATGLTGFFWIVWWLRSYHEPEAHPRITPAELAYIRSDPVEKITPIPWRKVVGYRQTWAFALGKFMTDPVWWLYLFWIPDFLFRNYQVDLKSVGLPLVIIYLVADVGSIGG